LVGHRSDRAGEKGSSILGYLLFLLVFAGGSALVALVVAALGGWAFKRVFWVVVMAGMALLVLEMQVFSRIRNSRTLRRLRRTPCGVCGEVPGDDAIPTFAGPAVRIKCRGCGEQLWAKWS